MVMENGFVTGGDAASLTRIVKFGLPAMLGAPLITPVFAFKVSPAGSDPDATDHVYDPTPPVAAKVTEYGAPTAPVGKGDGVVIVSAPLIVIESGFVTAGDAASFT